jgi:hypothetical protein
MATMKSRDHTREISSFRHILSTIKATAKTMVVAALCSAILGIAAIEVYGYATTGTASTLSTHLLAVVVGLVCAYGAVMTVLLRGMIETLVDSVEWVATEIERVTSELVHQAETVEGSILHHSNEQEAFRDKESLHQMAGSRF